jgi:DNA polymerase-4
MPFGQLSLFPDRRVDLARERRIQAALDAVRDRFGRSAVRWGVSRES